MLRSVFVWAELAIAAAGCGAPEPPQNVNAYLPKNVPVIGAGIEVCDKADTLVLAQCTQSKEYATIVEGNWVNSWCVTAWKVLQVERGKWPQETISFIFCDKWPTPQPGIMVRKAPIPYYTGAIQAFCIDTADAKTTIVATRPNPGGPTYVLSADRKCMIVATQPRSRIPPHGPIQWPTYDVRDPNSRDLFGRIVDAAKVFVHQQRGATGTANVSEQYGDLYVVEIKTDDNSWAVVVNADGLAVKWADPADAPN